MLPLKPTFKEHFINSILSFVSIIKVISKLIFEIQLVHHYFEFRTFIDYLYHLDFSYCKPKVIQQREFQSLLLLRPLSFLLTHLLLLKMELIFHWLGRLLKLRSTYILENYI